MMTHTNISLRFGSEGVMMIVMQLFHAAKIKG